MVTVGARGAIAIVGTVAVAVQTTAGLATALARTLHGINQQHIGPYFEQ